MGCHNYSTIILLYQLSKRTVLLLWIVIALFYYAFWINSPRFLCCAIVMYTRALNLVGLCIFTWWFFMFTLYILFEIDIVGYCNVMINKFCFHIAFLSDWFTRLFCILARPYKWIRLFFTTVCTKITMSGTFSPDYWFLFTMTARSKFSV